MGSQVIRFQGGLFLPLFFLCASLYFGLSANLVQTHKPVYFGAGSTVIMGQKRGRDSKPQAVEAKKRKKGAKVAAAAEGDGTIGVDDLNWKEVAMPDRMADAEGFFGLEEIDGVDVIRASDNGVVQFKV